MTALREIKILRELESPYVVRLLDVFPHKRNLSLVMPDTAPSTSISLQALYLQLRKCGHESVPLSQSCNDRFKHEADY